MNPGNRLKRSASLSRIAAARCLGAVVVVTGLCAAGVGCGSTGDDVRASTKVPSTDSVPQRPDDSVVDPPDASLPATPDDLPLDRSYTNHNDRSTPMGTACWAFTEFMHMVSSFAIPVIDGKPLYANEYTNDASRKDVVVAKLSELVDLEASVVDDLPDDVRPLVDYLMTKQASTRDALRSGAGPGDLGGYNDLFLAQFGDSEHWPGGRAFVAAADANPACDLDPTP